MLRAIAAAVLIAISVGSYAIFRGGPDPSRSGIRSIAILPFNSIGSNDDGGTSGIGLADILITRLSNIREIDVRPTGAVLNLAGLDSRAAGERLQVDAVLEGTIARTDDNVRVTARLINVIDGTTIWAAELERPRADELSLQNEIAVRLLASLSVRLRPDEATNFRKRFTESPEAYDLYVRGRYFWNKRTIESMSEAQRLFQNAVERDPNFALAYVGLADTVMMSEIQPSLSHKAVDRALQIDPNLGEAHATLGFIKMFLEWNWDEAETSFKRSIDLSPNYATSHHWYATLLAVRGQFDEAKREMRRAIELDPLSQNFLADLGQIHYFAGEYREAEDYCRRALAIDPDFGFAHRYLYDIYILTGD
ncbi:MAG: FlgO family outer membrane protein, partial [Pyrinomonadaceae bacterium]